MRKKRNRKLVLHVILIAVVACIAVAAILVTIGSMQVASVYSNLIEEELKVGAIQMADEIERMYPGEWNLDEDDVEGRECVQGTVHGRVKRPYRFGLRYFL